MRLALVTHKFIKGDGQGRVNYEIAVAALAAGHVVWLIASEIAPELSSHARARTVRIGISAWPSALIRHFSTIRTKSCLTEVSAFSTIG